MTIFWDTALFSLVEVDQWFKGVCHLKHGITHMMEAVWTSETLVYFKTKWCYILQTCHVHTHCCENLVSHNLWTV
jgi:hypothetical protein